MIYYCNIGCCPEECGCCDCEMNATKEDNTQCKEPLPDHPANFNKEKHIEYPRRMLELIKIKYNFLNEHCYHTNGNYALPYMCSTLIY